MSRYSKLIAMVAAVAIIGPFALAQGPAIKKVDIEVKADDKKPDVVKKADLPIDPKTSDERILKDVGLPTNGPALLDYLRRQTFPEPDPKQMELLIVDLGDDDFYVREAASAKLIQLGKGAILGLKAAEKDTDFEVKRRAEDLRKKLEAKVEPAIQAATARLIARQKPEGAAEVLISFVPFSADLAVIDETCKSLAAVTMTPKGVDPAVVAALDDKTPLKRAAAGEAIARVKAAEYLPHARKLLNDPEPIVRVRTGVALINSRDSSSISDAVPALIDCLKFLPPENLWAVEDLLIRLAGEDKVPSTSLGRTDAAKEACFKAWRAWYDANQKDIALARLDQTDAVLGNTLLVYQSNPRANMIVNNNGVVRLRAMGEVVEVDINKKVLWKMSLEDAFPVEAQVVIDQPGEVVLAEFQRGRVTVRDIKSSKIVWERNIANPIGVQSLPGGKFLVTTQNRIVEIDREKNEERTIVNRPNNDIYRSRWTKSGEIVYITNGGLLSRVDAKGKLLKNFQVPQIPVLFGSFDVLVNGNVLIPDFAQQRVVEYDTNGNQVNQFNTPYPNVAMRLPNGHTLVASNNARRVTEINRAGNVVWQYDVDGQLHNARRR